MATKLFQLKLSINSELIVQKTSFGLNQISTGGSESPRTRLAVKLAAKSDGELPFAIHHKSHPEVAFVNGTKMKNIIVKERSFLMLELFFLCSCLNYFLRA
ncbi:Uncharacterised protein [Serratia grimesii]|nr:Uncharacterised protein [Serratia grimesii]SMZ56173.1 Uncharacterised protein [Serratia grimesii]